ncbi:MAG: hypothetical protein ACYCV8_10330, partial [bacterium]
PPPPPPPPPPRLVNFFKVVYREVGKKPKALGVDLRLGQLALPNFNFPAYLLKIEINHFKYYI